MLPTGQLERSIADVLNSASRRISGQRAEATRMHRRRLMKEILEQRLAQAQAALVLADIPDLMEADSVKQKPAGKGLLMTLLADDWSLPTTSCSCRKTLCRHNYLPEAGFTRLVRRAHIVFTICKALGLQPKIVLIGRGNHFGISISWAHRRKTRGRK